jgi:hypothetical protein
MARAAGKSGKSLPSWAAAEPRLRAAYFEGAGTADPEATETPETQPQRSPKKTGGSRSSANAARPSGSRTRKAGAATRRRWQQQSRIESGARSAAGQLRAHPLSLGSGSAGGLMLAVFVYPIVLNLLQGGPPYAVAWLKAKFLNDVGTTVGAPPPPSFYNNGNVGPGDAQS